MFDNPGKVPVNHKNAHARPRNLDPKTNGPFLDDIRKEQEAAYREARSKALKSLEEEEVNAPNGE